MFRFHPWLQPGRIGDRRSIHRLGAALATGGLIGTSLLAAAIPASATGAPSPVATTPPPPATVCTTTGPVVPKLITPRLTGWSGYSTLTATNDRGTWAGIRYGGDYAPQVISWRAGTMRVLDTLRYTNDSLDLNNPPKVVGVSADGSVTVATKDPATRRTVGYRYQNGHRYVLAHSPDWSSFSPTGVSPDGLVAGYVTTRTGRFVVQWSGAGSGRVAVLATGWVYPPVVDAYDDVVWTYWHGGVIDSTRARTPRGAIINLHGPNDVPWRGDDISLAAGRYVWGSAGLDSSVVWDLSRLASLANGSTLMPVKRYPGQDTYLITVAPSGAFVNATAPTSRNFGIVDALGDRDPLQPSFKQPWASYDFGVYGIGSDGTVAVTGTDGNVRFHHCALNYARHNPRGTLYPGAVVGGQTVLAGGAWDPDSAGLHPLVDVYDQTTGKTFVGRVSADQADAAFGTANHVAGNHRFRLTLTPASGRHRYCAYALNVGLGNQNPLLGCTTVTA